jgi:hypothetical protein
VTSSSLRRRGAPALLLALVGCLGTLVATPSLAGFGGAQGGGGGGASGDIVVDSITLGGSGDLKLTRIESSDLGVVDGSDSAAYMELAGITISDELGGTGSATFAGFLEKVSSITTGVGSETDLVADQSGLRINNTGTTVKASCRLPDDPTVGTHYFFDNVDSDGLRVVANTGDTIRLGDTTSASAGYFESVRVGSSFHLVATSATTWVAVDGITGTWRADSTTSAGCAYTPTPLTAYTLAHSWDADADVSEQKCVYVHDGAMVTAYGIIFMAGAPPAADLTITTPFGSLDESTIRVTYATSELGTATVYDDGGTSDRGPPIRISKSGGQVANTFLVSYYNGSNQWVPVTDSLPFAWGANDTIVFRITYPVTQ